MLDMFEVKPQMIHIEFIQSWLRSEIDRLNKVLTTIDHSRDYRDSYIRESLRSSEMALRGMRKFIHEN